MTVARFGHWLFVLISGLIVPAVAADKNLTYNPFSKPEALAPVQTPSKTVMTTAQQAMNLPLNATLVSNQAPLAIVNGELLGIGEEIQGYRLLSVDEGRAVFEKQGQRHTLLLLGSGVNIE